MISLAHVATLPSLLLAECPASRTPKPPSTSRSEFSHMLYVYEGGHADGGRGRDRDCLAKDTMAGRGAAYVRRQTWRTGAGGVAKRAVNDDRRKGHWCGLAADTRRAGTRVGCQERVLRSQATSLPRAGTRRESGDRPRILLLDVCLVGPLQTSHHCPGWPQIEALLGDDWPPSVLGHFVLRQEARDLFPHLQTVGDCHGRVAPGAGDFRLALGGATTDPHGPPRGPRSLKVQRSGPAPGPIVELSTIGASRGEPENSPKRAGNGGGGFPRRRLSRSSAAVPPASGGRRGRNQCQIIGHQGSCWYVRGGGETNGGGNRRHSRRKNSQPRWAMSEPRRFRHAPTSYYGVRWKWHPDARARSCPQGQQPNWSGRGIQGMVWHVTHTLRKHGDRTHSHSLPVASAVHTPLPQPEAASTSPSDFTHILGKHRARSRRGRRQQPASSHSLPSMPALRCLIRLGRGSGSGAAARGLRRPSSEASASVHTDLPTYVRMRAYHPPLPTPPSTISMFGPPLPSFVPPFLSMNALLGEMGEKHVLQEGEGR